MSFYLCLKDTAGVLTSQQEEEILSSSLCYQYEMYSLIASLDCHVIKPESFDDSPMIRPYDFQKLRELINQNFSDDEDSPLPGNQGIFLNVCDFVAKHTSVYFYPSY